MSRIRQMIQQEKGKQIPMGAAPNEQSSKAQKQ